VRGVALPAGAVGVDANLTLNRTIEEHRMSNGSSRHRALVLLGPTGSGKTPLGDLIEQRGLWGLEWVHFDFGAQLRGIVAQEGADGEFAPAEVDSLDEVLHTGALLEAEQFPLAERILRSFLGRRAPDYSTCVVLNGLPRRVEQAKALEPIVNVGTVLSLRCTSNTIMERVRSNVGGDRAQRVDDDPAMVLTKLALFNERTTPLVDHYRELDVPVRRIVVTAAMTPEEIWRILQHRGC